MLPALYSALNFAMLGGTFVSTGVTDIAALLAAAHITAEEILAIPNAQDHAAYRVNGPDGDFIIRLAGDEAYLEALRREERMVAGLRGRVTLLIPDTTIVESKPPFAVHRLIQGEPLTTELYDGLSLELRERLVTDLATFFHETHAIPLELACDWLGVSWEGKSAAAAMRGTPLWFSQEAVRELRSRLDKILDTEEQDVFVDTVRRFEALDTYPDYMVFGHGDIHGFNLALRLDTLGPRLTGVFDFGCAGILDIHEDFFRLSLVSEDLLERVVAQYGRLGGSERRIDRERIRIYYRAFLFYLMSEVSGEGLVHLKRLLQAHRAYGQTASVERLG
jgi:aminoglycoside phosphotransferase (APT) family kinase protein